MFNFELKGSRAALKTEALKRLTENKMTAHGAFVAAQIDALPPEIDTLSLAVTTRGKVDKDAGNYMYTMQVRIEKLDMLK